MENEQYNELIRTNANLQQYIAKLEFLISERDRKLNTLNHKYKFVEKFAKSMSAQGYRVPRPPKLD